VTKPISKFFDEDDGKPISKNQLQYLEKEAR